eukprot:g8000.t1
MPTETATAAATAEVALEATRETEIQDQSDEEIDCLCLSDTSWVIKEKNSKLFLAHEDSGNLTEITLPEEGTRFVIITVDKKDTLIVTHTGKQFGKKVSEDIWEPVLCSDFFNDLYSAEMDMKKQSQKQKPQDTAAAPVNAKAAAEEKEAPAEEQQHGNSNTSNFTAATEQEAHAMEESEPKKTETPAAAAAAAPNTTSEGEGKAKEHAEAEAEEVEDQLEEGSVVSQAVGGRRGVHRSIRVDVQEKILDDRGGPLLKEQEMELALVLALTWALT